MTVDLFIPCFIDQFFPNVGLATVNVLKHFGCEINYNPKQTCCGQPAFNTGYFEEAKKVAKYFYDTFSGDNLIVGPSGSCVSMVKVFYKDLIEKDKFEKLSSRIFEITYFLESILKINLSNYILKKDILLHQGCHLTRELGTLENTKKLLKQIQGLNLIDFKYKEECCGFGGTFSAKFDKLSIDMGKDKLKYMSETGCEWIVSTDSSCLMHLEGIANNLNYKFKFNHVIELIELLIK